MNIVSETQHQNLPNAAYHGYFENERGEQSIFLYDWKNQQATLFRDTGYQTDTYEIINSSVPGLHLPMTEQLWLRICWSAVNKLRATQFSHREAISSNSG